MESLTLEEQVELREERDVAEAHAVELTQEVAQLETMINSLKLPPTMWDDIAEFHKKMRIAYNGPPRELPVDVADFRLTFLCEELDEYDIAVRDRDRIGQLDALIDLVYVALGTAYLHGYDFQEGWNRVHEANLKKVPARLRPELSKRDHPHDVVKPEGWQPPVLTDLVYR